MGVSGRLSDNRSRHPLMTVDAGGCITAGRQRFLNGHEVIGLPSHRRGQLRTGNAAGGRLWILVGLRRPGDLGGGANWENGAVLKIDGVPAKTGAPYADRRSWAGSMPTSSQGPDRHDEGPDGKRGE